MSELSPGMDDGTDLTAAEYVLGLLDAHESEAAERRLVGDPLFARDVAAWETRFGGLIGEIAPETPPSRVWTEIARRLDASANVVDLALRRSRAVWRGVALAAGAVAATLAVVLVLPRQQPAPAPILTARLAGASGPAVFVATFDQGRHEMVVTPASVTADVEHTPELWLIPAGGKPIALGLVAFQHSVRMTPDPRVTGLATGVLAVSVEPKGGSPTGQPTGPVVATGQLEKL